MNIDEIQEELLEEFYENNKFLCDQMISELLKQLRKKAISLDETLPIGIAPKKFTFQDGKELLLKTVWFYAKNTKPRRNL